MTLPALLPVLGLFLAPLPLERPGDPETIVGGELVAPGTWPAVVGVTAGPSTVNRQLCTGTQVAPDLVLTAAHCLSSVGETGAVTVHFGDRMYGETSRAIPGASWGMHPDFCGKTKCGDDTFDFAYVRLAEAIDAPDPFPRPILEQEEWDRLMAVGEPVSLVGYGTDLPTGVAPDDGSFPKREAESTLRKITDRGLMFLAGGDPADSCSGDSGGPAFFVVEDGLVLAGILSQGSSPCGDGGYYGVPWAALPWLAEEIDWRPEGYDPDHTELDTGVSEGGCRAAPSPPEPWAMLGLLTFLLGPPSRRRLRDRVLRP